MAITIPVDPPITVRAGEVVHIRGANGSGKTTLLRRLAGLDGPVRDCAMVTQDPRDGLIGLTVGGEARLRGRAAVMDPERDVATLSDGETTRVALHFAGGTPLLLLDEAHAGLDAEGRRLLHESIDAQRGHGIVVYADHDAHYPADHVIDLGTLNVELPVLAPAPEGPCLEVDAGCVRRGPGIVTPAAAFGPGLTAVTGPNGCGKSSWLLGIAGLAQGIMARQDGKRPEAGRDIRMLLPGQRDHMRGERVAEVVSGLDTRLLPDDVLDRHPLTLSGGESRRVALTDVLGRPASIYLLDEPDRHLDAAGAAALLRWMDERIQQGAIIIAATHADWLIGRAHGHVAMEAP